MADSLTDLPSTVDGVHEEIMLNEGLLASLEDDEDSITEEIRFGIQKTLKRLRKRLSALSSSEPSQNLQYETNFTPTKDRNVSEASRQSNQQVSPYTFNLVSRKRPRTDTDGNTRHLKSLRTTPSPTDTGPHSATQSGTNTDDESSGEFANPSPFRKRPVDPTRNEARILRQLENRRKQEEADAEFARLLQSQFEHEQASSSSQPPPPRPPTLSYPSTSSSQSFIKADGSLKRQLSQPLTSNISYPASLSRPVKPEPLSYPSLHTPISLADDEADDVVSISASDDDFFEIDRTQFMPRARPLPNQISRSGPSRPLPASFSRPTGMPGAFPGALSYKSQAGTSVYNNPYGPSTSYRPAYVPAYVSGRYSLPGSYTAPLDLDTYTTFQDAWADPAKTQEDLKELLKQIRPDEEISTEQREQMPIGLKKVLMKHQAAGVAWMKKMEDSSNKGGILADDMGLGKTIQAIALMLARPPPKDDHRPTLIVAPVALMQQWKREFDKFVRSSHRLEVLVLHGSSRPTNYTAIKNYDVVLTTYGLLSSELKKSLQWEEKKRLIPDARPSPKEDCVILGERSKFHRVILDEAQNVKNRTTKSAIAACRINATHRWCLSGTPMQNNVDEMFSLIKFCRIKPYCYWETFAKDFSRPLKGRSMEDKEKAMEKLQALLKAILLRRTKKSKLDGKPILELPDKNTVEDRAHFNSDEHDFYNAMEKRAQIQFNKYLSHGSIGQHYGHALTLLLRLRQACCHPKLVSQSKDFLQSSALEPMDLIKNAKELPYDVIERLKELEAFECPVCMDANPNPAIFPCGHALCEDCLSKLCDQAATNEENSRAACPHCRSKIDPNKCTDLMSFLRVHCSDREGVEPLGANEIDNSDSETESESEDGSDDGADLRDFVVPDEAEDSDNPDEDDQKGKGKSVKAKPRRKEVRARKRPMRKDKGKKADKDKSLAELRKEGLRSRSAKRKYLKKLSEDWQSSAKIDKTIELLQEIEQRGEDEKTIVFSSFTSFLDLLEVPLSRDESLGNYVRYDGSMSPFDRNASVINFTDNKDCKVILVSLKAGNAGLNLTAANHVIILDPFWNPFVEYQAADRCYRIGQTREVTIHRVLIGPTDEQDGARGRVKPRQNEEGGGAEDDGNDFTVEDRILRLQEKKRQLVETALDENAAQGIARLGVRELGYLFGLNGLN